MSHCYSVGVKIGKEEKEICTLVPGNEDLAKHVKEMEDTNGTPRKPTKEEIDRAIEFHIGNHKNNDHPLVGPEETNKKELQDMVEEE